VTNKKILNKKSIRFEPKSIDQFFLTDFGIFNFFENVDAEVDQAINEANGTMLVVVNSVCGCAAGNMRPGVKLSLHHDKFPNKLTSESDLASKISSESNELMSPIVTHFVNSSNALNKYFPLVATFCRSHSFETINLLTLVVGFPLFGEYHNKNLIILLQITLIFLPGLFTTNIPGNNSY
jgi:putative YphP/YqiW family bacilliredoxin